MSLKAKLVSSVAAFCLVLALLVVGILATNTATVNMGGTISFTATDVNATVQISVEGTTETVAPVTYTYSAEKGNATENWTMQNWTYNADRMVTITITVTNNDTARKLNVAYTAPVSTSFTNTTLGGTATNDSIELDNATVGQGTSNVTEITITFKPTNENLAAVANWTATLVLTDPSVA